MKKVDQRGFDNQRSPYLDGARAAEFLGVKRETLYAYASRGLLRSEPGGGGRARRYSREDLERLKARHDARSGHAAVAGGALRWGEAVLETAIGTIDARGPIYRGLSAIDLAAEGRSVESVAELLWTGTLPSNAPEWPTPARPLAAEDLARRVPRSARPVDALGLAVAALGLCDKDRAGGTEEAELARARNMMLEIAALTGLRFGARRVTAARRQRGVAGRLLVALGGPDGEEARRALTRALVLLADHELNVSSFAVRVTASSGADLYACVTTGLAAVTGPRHGGEVDKVEALATEAGSPRGASATIEARIRRGESIPGFGHRIYPAGDPRAAPLLAAAHSLAPKHERVRTVFALEAAMRRSGRPHATVDLGLAALAAALDLPEGSGSAIFATGRVAGWIAHALEQRSQGFLLRPRARYIGHS